MHFALPTRLGIGRIGKNDEGEDQDQEDQLLAVKAEGILKKAGELSLLCESKAVVIIFSQPAKLFDFSSSRYQPCTTSHHLLNSFDFSQLEQI
ncbi:MADS-box protein AGL24-like [Pyrus ussuriensis x Pyrus communis]|uniref:MADS-box protein AGL24-like n=1 Tax=Pyrus ussuriensis x Pyrus communis TaxID=2448454 RepID=A0A5N5F4E8_9ROSA|nr:MADS-box protein AGL24-like [Pyrus ussuriensis x Pyrus communis]